MVPTGEPPGAHARTASPSSLSTYPESGTCQPEPRNQAGKTSIHPNFQGRRLVSLPSHQPKLSRLIESGGPPTCVTRGSSGRAAGSCLHMRVVLYLPNQALWLSLRSAQPAPRERPGPVHHFRRGRHLLVGAPAQHPQRRPQRLSGHLLVPLR